MNAQLIVALDIPDPHRIAALVDRMPPAVNWYKVGLELFAAGGPHALRPLTDHGKQVFLDLKLHDIPRTVARAVRAAAGHGAAMLTVHAGGGHNMLRAAAEAAATAGPRRPKLLAVTTLTSLAPDDLTRLGIHRPLKEHTLALGRMAVDAGIDGLVCSVHEAADFRRLLGSRPLLVTPGVRPAGNEAGDQKRVATPADAVKAGADFLVVGRPILEAADPRAAAENILREMQAPPQ
jgi:orotidine-5'-phosphate decarboxylase